MERRMEVTPLGDPWISGETREDFEIVANKRGQQGCGKEGPCNISALFYPKFSVSSGVSSFIFQLTL